MTVEALAKEVLAGAVYKMADGTVLDAHHTLIRSDLDILADEVLRLSSLLAGAEGERDRWRGIANDEETTADDFERRLGAAEDERNEALQALREARPYVFNRTLPPGHPERDWRSETAESILATVDAALAFPDSAGDGRLPSPKTESRGAIDAAVFAPSPPKYSRHER